MDVTWHTSHLTFTSRLLNRGVDIVTVQQLLGHSAITVTISVAPKYLWQHNLTKSMLGKRRCSFAG